MMHMANGAITIVYTASTTMHCEPGGLTATVSIFKLFLNVIFTIQQQSKQINTIHQQQQSLISATLKLIIQ